MLSRNRGSKRTSSLTSSSSRSAATTAGASISSLSSLVHFCALVVFTVVLAASFRTASAGSSSSNSNSPLLGKGSGAAARRHQPLAAISTANMLTTPNDDTQQQPRGPPDHPMGTGRPTKAAAAAAAAPTNSTNGLLFGDRVLGRRRPLATAASASGAGASPSSSAALLREEAPVAVGEGNTVPHTHTHVGEEHRHPHHEEALPLDLTSSIERPTPVLLAEGPDFRFEFISQCELPTARGLFNLRAYRYTKTNAKGGGALIVEPVVLFQGEHHNQREVLVRVHDQCLTSEVLGSRRCDCKEQLELALDRIVANEGTEGAGVENASTGGGLIIYLPQEGRGIGLANKVAAYALQEQGLDTVDANLFLGFGDDERTYDYVRYILQDFGIASIRLATNNPFKVRSLRESGVEVEAVEALQAPANRHNLHYLRTKILKMEHSMDLSLGQGGVGGGGGGGGGSSSSGSTDGGDNDTATTPEVLTETGSEKEHLLDQQGLEEEVVDERDDQEAEELARSLKEATTLVTSGEGEAQSQEEAALANVVYEEESGPPKYCFGKDTVEAAIKAIAEGKMVVVVDDEDRENEGDIIMAADACTTEAMAFIVRYCSGVVCVSLEGPELERLKLPPMIANNEDPKHTAFTVSVDYKHNTTTGISAHDRAATLRALADPKSKPTDFTRPGHIFPLRYAPGGVRKRRGHTEAALDLSRMAGRRPVGALCEICNDDGSMARLPDLEIFCKKHNLVLTSIADMVAYRREREDAKR